MKKAKDINDLGVYEFELEPTLDPDEISLNNIIRLKLDTKHKDIVKKYTYDELRDLHDKLILVVGRKLKDKEIIEDFEQVFQ